MTNLTESENKTVSDDGVVKMKYDITTNSTSNATTQLTVTTSIPNGTNYSIPVNPGIKNYSNSEIVTKALSY